MEQDKASLLLASRKIDMIYRLAELGYIEKANKLYSELIESSLTQIPLLSGNNVRQLLLHKDFNEFGESLLHLKYQIQKEMFSYPCSKKWNELIQTDAADAKYCDVCNKYVHKVFTDEDFIKRAELGQCIAVDSSFAGLDILLEEFSEKADIINMLDTNSNEEMGLPMSF
jgi:hypothetical protein